DVVPLVITIEEAHKFLDKTVAGLTIFGTIAREMRKHKVTLLIVDQRPSAIDDEVMSQIGTRICCLLDNEKDVDAALSGVSGRTELRSVLARLDSKQQALIMGHAVPMPIVIKTRDYGTPESYQSLQMKGFRFATSLRDELGEGGAQKSRFEDLWNDPDE
ncbi:MAG: ATP-binding protein, partial [Dehalococcoidia bacterium]|nr:ATP-binding protein [Dehalococcoidia bacterium]